MPAKIVAVISNNSSSGALSLARSFGIPAIHFSRRQFPDPKLYQSTLLDILLSYKTNFIVLAGYMKKLDVEIIRAFPESIINIHPALLPKYGGEGMYGMHVHEAVIAAKERISGASVHYVSEEYDEGAIIAQQTVSVDVSDSPESLAAKVLQAEHQLLPSVVKNISETRSS